MHKQILVPLAMDTDHDPAKALSIAQSLADEGAEITLLHVMEHIPRYAVQYIEPADLETLRDGIKAELERLASGIPGGRGALIEGHGGRSIVDYAERLSADLIVVHSHRPGVADLFLGSTAAFVVRHAATSVHVIR